jgi:hypothetical protein
MREDWVLSVLVTLAVSVVLVLLAIAIYYQWRLYRQRKQVEERKQRIERQRADQQEIAYRSIEILCRAIIDDQVSLTEGCIRVSVMLRSLALSEKQLDAYNVFFDLESATAHIPILENWRKLSRKQQYMFDNERVDIEEKYRDFVVDAARRFLTQGIPPDKV